MTTPAMIAAKPTDKRMASKVFIRFGEDFSVEHPLSTPGFKSAYGRPRSRSYFTGFLVLSAASFFSSASISLRYFSGSFLKSFTQPSQHTLISRPL